MWSWKTFCWQQSRKFQLSTEVHGSYKKLFHEHNCLPEQFYLKKMDPIIWKTFLISEHFYLVTIKESDQESSDVISGTHCITISHRIGKCSNLSCPCSTEGEARVGGHKAAAAAPGAGRVQPPQHHALRALRQHHLM